MATIAMADNNQEPFGMRGFDNRLWVTINNSNTYTFYYSNDGGDTWSQPSTGSTRTSTSTGTWTLDSEGYLHFVADPDTGYANYYRGTVTDDGDTITWGNSLVNTMIISNGALGRMHAIPQSDGSTDVFFIVKGGNHGIWHLTVSSGGTASSNGRTAIATVGGMNVADFVYQHDGDGITPSSTPHLFIAYKDSSSNSTWLWKKLTYSSGSWTAGSARTVASSVSTSYSIDRNYMVYNPEDDYTYFIIYNASTSTAVLYKVDAGDTTSSAVDQETFTNSSSALQLREDSSGNLYIGYKNTSDNDYEYNRLPYNTTTWDGLVEIRATTDGTSLQEPWSWVHGKYGGSLAAITGLWSTSPDTTYYDEVVAFTTAPTWASPEEGSEHKREQELILDWNFQDPDGGATQSAYRIKRIVDAATTTYWNGTDWQATADSSTKISTTASQHTLPQNWAEKTDTSHEYQVMTWDNTDSASEFSLELTIYPTSIESVNRGLSLPRPYKKQDNLVGTLKSNNDYMLGWVNSYVPSYGDANDDLTLRAGLRAASQSLMRDVFPPVIGEYSVGNDTSYFNNLGATNVYRTNELALSSKRFKDFKDKKLIPNAIEFISKLPLSTYSYKDKKKNGDAKHRIGLTAEDLVDAILESGDTPKDSSLVMHTYDEDGEIVWHINEAQLIPILWQAVQELSEEVFKLKDKNT